MSVKKCSHCGKELPEELQFCPYCMERTTEPVKATVPADKKKLNRKSIIIIIVAIALVLLLAVGIVLLSGDKNNKNDQKAGTQSTNSTQSTSADDSTAENGTSVSEETSKNVSIKDISSIISNKKDENVSSTSNNSSTTDKNTTTTTTTSNKNNSVSECNHNWVAITEIVHHDEVGHYEDVQNKESVTKYKCPVCYEKFASLDDYYTHFDNTHTPSYDGDPIKALRNQYTTESGYEYYETKEWVVDKEAYDEIVITGYKCSICEERKED